MEMQVFSWLHVKFWHSPWPALLLGWAQTYDVIGEQVKV